MAGLHSSANMSRLKENLLHHQYEGEKVDVSDYQYVPEAVIREFISEAPKEIAGYFDQMKLTV